MKNKLEQILLSILLSLSVLLGLSFLLNIIFSFNIFCAEHWEELTKLQVSKTPVNIGFYASFAVAILIFTVGLFFIFRANKTKEISVKTTQSVPQQIANQTESRPEQKNIAEPTLNISKPPRLNLPNNMAQIVVQNHTNQEKIQNTPSQNPYNPTISKIFTDNGYIVKQNPTISGFVPNLFAIGNNEVVWIGGVDCDKNNMITAIQKLQYVFQTTLEDIKIHINAFILDTMNKQDNNNDILIFKTIEDLKEFIENHPADKIEDMDQDSFDSYSEYIDTIIQYIKNV